MILPDFSDILSARECLAGHAVETPLIESPLLNQRLGGRVLIKPECLQRTGSFKFRGAWNHISRLPGTMAGGGVVAYSSGNHAQGVAAAAAIRKFPALIVMPRDTPRIKMENTRALGAGIVTYDRASEVREEIAEKIAGERGAAIVPPYDDPHVIAGQGTCGLELVRAAQSMNADLSDVLVCTGGGGLTAGVALAVKELAPGCRVHAVEPEGFDDHARSLKTGNREINEALGGSICDALLAPQPGKLTFALNANLLAGAVSVSEAQVVQAMRFAFESLKLVVEPGGAVALAAVLSGKIKTQGRTIGVVISGGNADRELFAKLLNS